MHRVLQFGFVLLCLTGFSYGQSVECSYFGEPHLVPYPTECEPIQNQYVCQPQTPELMVKNQYVQVNVVSSPIGNYPIVQYTLTIFGGVPGFPDSCTISANVNILSPFPPTCPATSPVIIVQTSTTNYVILHRTQPGITIHVDKIKRYFEIYVDIPFSLVPDTEGVCVDWDCEFETYLIPGLGKRDTGNALISALCDEAINEAVQAASAYGTVDQGKIHGRRVACNYDLIRTGDVAYLLGVVRALLRSAFDSYKGTPKYSSLCQQAEATCQQIDCNLSNYVTSAVNQYGTYCADSGNGTQCIKADPDPSCSGSRGTRDEN